MKRPLNSHDQVFFTSIHHFDPQSLWMRQSHKNKDKRMKFGTRRFSRKAKPVHWDQEYMNIEEPAKARFKSFEVKKSIQILY